MHMDTARTAAVNALLGFLSKPECSSAAEKINYYICKYKLQPRDAAFASRLFFTALENEKLCSFYLSELGVRRWDSIPPVLQGILLLGAVQILFFSRVPDAAAVNTSVEICRQKGQIRACAFINALLRRLSKVKENLPAIPKNEKAEYLSILYSHPKWLVERMIEIYGIKRTEKILQYNNSAIQITLQINTCRCSTAKVKTLFDTAGVRYTLIPDRNDCLILERVGSVEKLPGYKEGYFYVQDDACRRSVEFADLKPGSRIWDACAAPGGKSMAAAILLNDVGYILSSDLNRSKIERIRENTQRLGFTCIHPICWDAKERMEDIFDCVLADVPCSGTGVISKRPEIRFKAKESVSSLPRVQREIMDSVSQSVKPGGILLYMTCSLLPEENMDNVKIFLDQNRNFELAPLEANSNDPAKTFLPGVHYMDGFFVCKMKRKE